MEGKDISDIRRKWIVSAQDKDYGKVLVNALHKSWG
jgi:hypothetical protein